MRWAGAVRRDDRKGNDVDMTIEKMADVLAFAKRMEGWDYAKVMHLEYRDALNMAVDQNKNDGTVARLARLVRQAERFQQEAENVQRVAGMLTRDMEGERDMGYAVVVLETMQALVRAEKRFVDAQDTFYEMETAYKESETLREELERR